MPLRRLPRKQWYTLQDAANFLQSNTDEPLQIKQEDLLQYASEGLLTLAIKLFSTPLPENVELLKLSQNQRIRMGLRAVKRSQKKWVNGRLIYENNRFFLPREELIPERILLLGEKEAEGTALSKDEKSEITSLSHKLTPERFDGNPEFYYRSESIEEIGLVESVDEGEKEAVVSQNRLWELFLNKNSEEIINQIWRQCHNTPDIPRDTFRVPNSNNPKIAIESCLESMELLFRDPAHKYVLRVTPSQIPADALLGATPENLNLLLAPHTSESTEDEDYISHYLRGMNEAAFQYWKTAEKGNTAGHATNQEVAEWLVENYAMSRSKAKHAASLIRPRWAGVGRKPGK